MILPRGFETSCNTYENNLYFSVKYVVHAEPKVYRGLGRAQLQRIIWTCEHADALDMAKWSSIYILLFL